MIKQFFQAHCFPLSPLNHFPILFDHREEASEFLDFVCEFYLARHESCFWYPVFVNLEIGDAQPTNEDVVEIKRVTTKWNPKTQANYNDFFQSRTDGRLYNQANDCFQNFKHPYMIIQIDKGAKFLNREFGQHEFMKMSLTLMRNFNKHIIFTESFEETLEVIIGILMCALDKDDHLNPINKKKKADTLYEQQLIFLSGLQGRINLKKAESLLQHKLTPLMVLKAILEAEVSYTKNGKPKNTTFDVKGFSFEFVLQNQGMLNTISKEIQLFLKKQQGVTTNDQQ